MPSGTLPRTTSAEPRTSVDTPFFIVGAQRSGTTLLRLMLAAHPRLSIPPESHFIPDLWRLERESGGLEHLRKTVADLLVTHDRLVDFGLPADWIRETVATLTPLTTRTITEAVFAEYARRHDRPRWGDKTPRYRNFLPELATLFPEARFIHVVRDGRDTALSSVRAAFGPTTLAAAAYLWRDSIRAALAGAQALARDRWAEVSYEQLLREPERVLRDVCTFLGETFHADMLRYAERAGELVPAWERSWHAKLAAPLDASNTGKWRRDLTADQIALIERIAGSELARFGYTPAAVDVGVAASARIRLTCARYHAQCLAARLAGLVRRSGPVMSRTAFVLEEERHGAA